MRIRKESDQFQEEEVLLIAKASDALAHPARVQYLQIYIQCEYDPGKHMQQRYGQCLSITRRRPFPST
jgi:hypothetical protein